MSFDILQEIKDNRKRFRVDHFDIVISEYISRYKNKKLNLNPPYQRQFRWDEKTQSALIESILIGIPLPPIFAFSNSEYVWEIIDGLQRTTTLINFLLQENRNVGRFTGCEILKELNNKTLNELPEAVRNSINNARLRIELVEDNDDPYSQYLLFSRLNNNGESLSSQELRNFLIYKLNPNFYNVISNDLRKFNSFVKVMALPLERTQKQDDVEYIVRFFISRKIMLRHKYDRKKYSRTYLGIDDTITHEIQEYLKSSTKETLNDDYEAFKGTFDYLNKLQNGHGYKAFSRKLNSLPNTSVIAPALSTCLEKYKNMDDVSVKKIIMNFYQEKNYKKITAQSYSPVRRFFELSIYANDYFNNK